MTFENFLKKVALFTKKTGCLIHFGVDLEKHYLEVLKLGGCPCRPNLRKECPCREAEYELKTEKACLCRFFVMPDYFKGGIYETPDGKKYIREALRKTNELCEKFNV